MLLKRHLDHIPQLLLDGRNMVPEEIKEARWWISQAARLDKYGDLEAAEMHLMQAAVTLVQAADILSDEVAA